MKAIKISLLAFFITIFSAQAQLSIKNPLPVAFGDPYVLHDGNGRYYKMEIQKDGKLVIHGPTLNKLK